MDISYCYEHCAVGKAASDKFLAENNSVLDAAVDFNFFTAECYKTCVKQRKTKENLSMKLIVGKNDTGKTRELIRQSLDSGIPIFAIHDGKANSLRDKSLSYFGKPVSIVTQNDFLTGNYCGDILIDDIEKVCTALLAMHLHTSDFNITTATITED